MDSNNEEIEEENDEDRFLNDSSEGKSGRDDDNIAKSNWNSNNKVKKYAADDSIYNYKKEDTEGDLITTQTEKNYVEMSPKERFGRVILFD
jgi:hypothetical protein